MFFFKQSKQNSSLCSQHVDTHKPKEINCDRNVEITSTQFGLVTDDH